MAIIKVKTGGITADAVTDALIADDVVGTEHLTANEVDTTALGADAVTGAQLADNAVNSEHYTDGSVDTAHIADAQITTAKLSTAVFTGATDIGADLADADLILVDDGAGGTIRKSALSRIKTYAGGGTNTPLFRVYAGSNWNISNGATSTIPFNSSSFNPQSTFNFSTYKFTPAVAGKYFFYSNIKMSSSGDQNLFEIYLKKNTDTVASKTIRGSGTGSLSLDISTTIDSDDNDEFYIQMYQASGGSITNYGGHNISYFTGFKLTE